MSWKRRFDDAIVLPDGRKLVTLRDAATYSTKLPKKEADSVEWQAAIESLMLVAELGGPTMFARIGVMRALNRHVERPAEGDAKSALIEQIGCNGACLWDELVTGAL